MPELSAPIVAVTVYTDRAQITRRGQLELTETGAQDLTVGGLPANLLTDSLRVSGVGTAQVLILGMDSKTLYFTDSPSGDLNALQQQLLQFDDHIAAVKGQAGTLTQRLTMLQKMAEEAASRYVRALATGKASIEQAQALLDFISAQTQAAKDEQTKLDLQLREVGRLREVVQAQINQRQHPRSRQNTLVTVPLEVGKVGDLTVELTYVVLGASWQPLYDLRIASPQQGSAPANAQPQLDGTLTLNYLASLSQNTGEDWQAVTLTLSTARPSLGTLPPKLEPTYLDIYSPPVARAMMMPMAAPAPMTKRSRSMERADDAAMGGLADEEEQMVMQAEMSVAEVNSSGASVTFKLPRPLDVPADGQPHRTMITGHDFPCKLDYSSVPRLASLAYLRATMTNDSPLTLLAGPANIFRDGEFVGNSHLENTAPRQEIKLFLGPDDQVRTERELAGREVERNFIGSNRRSSYAYLIKLENLKPYPVRLTVQDQIPVSRHESIKVKLTSSDPQPTEQSDLGLLRWELVLPASSKRELRYAYQVEQPRDAQVTGMD